MTPTTRSPIARLAALSAILLTAAASLATTPAEADEGTLTIALGASSPAASTLGVPAVNVPMLQLRLSASAEETLMVTDITVKAAGTGDDAAGIVALSLWRDVNLDGIISPGIDQQMAWRGGFHEDNGTAEIAVGPAGWAIPPESSQSFIIAATFASGIPIGETYRISVPVNDYIAVTNTAGEARTQVTGAPVLGSYITTDTKGSLTIELGEHNPPVGSIRPGSSDFPMLQVRLAASAAETLVVTSITIVASGTANDTLFIHNLKLWDDQFADATPWKLATLELDTVDAFSADNGAATFEIGGGGLVVPAGEARHVLVTADFPDSVFRNETYRLSIPLNSHITVTSTSGAARGNVVGAPVAGNYMTTGCGPIVTLLAGLSQPVVTATPGQQYVQVAHIRLTNVAEDLTVKSLVLHGSGTGDESSGISRIHVFRDANENGAYEPGIDDLFAVLADPYATDDGSAVVPLDRMITAGNTMSVLVTYDISAAARNNDAFQVAVRPADLVVTGTDDSAGEALGTTVGGPMVIVSGALSVDEARPIEFGLGQNTPNPFNPITSISFTLPQADNVRLVVCNTAGQIVRTLVDGQLQAGVHTVTWDARDGAGRIQGSGIYLCRLEANQGTQVRRMTLVR